MFSMPLPFYTCLLVTRLYFTLPWCWMEPCLCSWPIIDLELALIMWTDAELSQTSNLANLNDIIVLIGQTTTASLSLVSLVLMVWQWARLSLMASCTLSKCVLTTRSVSLQILTKSSPALTRNLFMYNIREWSQSSLQTLFKWLQVTEAWRLYWMINKRDN